MKIKIMPRLEPVPEGLYRVKLTGIGEKESKFGPAYNFEFAIVEGEFRDRKLWTVTKIRYEARENSRLYNLIKALTGKVPDEFDEIELDGLIGSICQAVVKIEKGDEKPFNKITEFLADK